MILTCWHWRRAIPPNHHWKLNRKNHRPTGALISSMLHAGFGTWDCLQIHHFGSSTLRFSLWRQLGSWGFDAMFPLCHPTAEEKKKQHKEQWNELTKKAASCHLWWWWGFGCVWMWDGIGFWRWNWVVATQTCELFSSRKIPIFIAIVQMGCNHQLGKFTFWVEQTPCGLDVSEDAGKHKSLEIVILLQRMGMLRFTPSMCKNTT